MSEFRISSSLFVPPQCEGCGVQCELGGELARLLNVKRMAERTGESLVGDSGERFDAMVEAEVPEEHADDVKQGIRMSVGESIEEIDRGIEGIKGEIDANALSCSGVLKMRASKDGVTYTASVCTSPRVYGPPPQPTQLPTHISAQPQK